MAGRRKDPVDPQKVQGFKKLRQLAPLLQQLRGSGCARDSAGNRELFFDEYVTLVLFLLLNPLIDSMRGLQRSLEFEQVAQRLGIRRFSLGSFSESVRVFDPELLKQVIEQLASQTVRQRSDPRLADLEHILVAVDGTILNSLSTVAAAWWLKFQDGTSKYAWRLHTHFDVIQGLPLEMELTDARGQGKSDEKNVLRRKLAPDHCYILDRWFAQFTLFNEINAIGSSYVCRAKENSVFETLQQRELTSQAQEAGVLRDVVVRMGMSSAAQARPDHPIRLVIVKAEPYEKRGGRRGKMAGPRNEGTLVIATNLLDVPAEIIALIYRYRWTVEVFFRFLKQLMGCRHLLSTKPEGIRIQMYCAIIACLLINLWTGLKPGKAMLEMMAFYFMGLASEAEVTRILTRESIRQRQREERAQKPDA